MKLFVLRLSPEDIPYSKNLLILLAILLFGIETFTNLWLIEIVRIYDPTLVLHLSVFSSMLISLVYLLIMFACVYSVLTYYKKQERSIQVITAFLGVDFILAILFLCWMLFLSTIDLPLQSGSGKGLIIILLYIMMLYWQFMVYIHIIFNSLNTSVLRSGIYALVYMLLQHNITEVLMSILLTKDST